ncbi:Hypothetical predicted protein [Mytilus galloprovincialis]|uniref:Uncharacterized protein n=1 Tax=Mytilus galloprovincialis TaxID=29158 RepID=A0A8B6F5P3_MYTGA|nr:Hypothetical predicted protein [Mytilus galloprovincialis]
MINVKSGVKTEEQPLLQNDGNQAKTEAVSDDMSTASQKTAATPNKANETGIQQNLQHASDNQTNANTTDENAVTVYFHAIFSPTILQNHENDDVFVRVNAKYVKMNYKRSVKPVFILETDLFGEVKPSPDQYLTHLELYNSIDSCIPKSHLKGLQRVRGMWRIYPDSENDRETLIIKKITVRNKLINVYSTNPKSSEYSSLLYLRVRVKDVPYSADDG